MREREQSGYLNSFRFEGNNGLKWTRMMILTVDEKKKEGMKRERDTVGEREREKPN